jgi:hypothetical protein
MIALLWAALAIASAATAGHAIFDRDWIGTAAFAALAGLAASIAL